MRSRFNEAAAEDLREARAFVSSHFGRQARRGLNTELRRAITLLRENPMMGRSAGGTAREYVLDGYPYSLIYYVEDVEVMIAALYHHSREPTFWHRRFGAER
ncbi:MAG TPA: type II toxin-antitoxin system RelE/ParE family toxin [Longimicrobium sp.]|nr:type II toxin-antitoxin system RelE/ParE family toxin [Longimicrobium sp.]